MSLRNKILVTGHPGTGGLEFIHNVLLASQADTPAEQQSQEDGRLSGIRIPWTIDTKYYTANVDFLLDEISTERESDRETVEAYAKKENEIGNVVDAFVYVFRKDKLETFHGARHWLPFLDEYDPAIRLCVGMTTKGGVVDTDSSVFEDWCLDYRFEYIDMDTAEENASEQALQALQTNMWDGLERKDTKAEPQPRDVDNLLQTCAINADTLKLSDDENDGSLDLPTDAEVSEMQRELFGTLDDDDEGLEKTLQRLQTMREQGKNLPDEERRKLAAQVALSFAAQLGL